MPNKTIYGQEITEKFVIKEYILTDTINLRKKVQEKDTGKTRRIIKTKLKN